MKKFATLTVIGRDKTGVVARITGFLFQQRGNIEALEEQVTRGQFSMTVQTSWKEIHLNRNEVVGGLQALDKELEMEIKLRFTDPARKQRMALMVTKEPHCFQKILESLHTGSLKKADAALVLSNRRDLEPLAREFGLPFAHVPWEERLKAEEKALRLLDEHEIDFIVLARFMKILSPNFVWRYKNKIINIHPSLLPRFRGPSPMRSAILNDEHETGVSIILLDEEMDHGPIVAQKKVSFGPPAGGWPIKNSELERVLLQAGGQLLAQILPEWVAGRIEAREQNHDIATYCEKIEKEDGLLDLNDDARKNLLKIRAFEGWPSTYTFFERGEKKIRVQILEARIENTKLIIERVKPEGKKEMAYAEFLRSGAVLAR